MGMQRDSSSKGGSYNLLSEGVAAIVHLADHLHSCEIEDQMATFEGGITGPADFPCANPDPRKPDRPRD